MNKLLKINTKNLILYTGLALILIIVGCVAVDSVDIPDHGTANEISTFTMHCSVAPRIQSSDPICNTKFVVGILVPKNWKAATNANLSYTSAIGEGTFTQVPSGTIEKVTGLDWPVALKTKFGNGGNLVDDMEWVVFQTDKPYSVVNNQDFAFDVTIKIKLGPDNMMVKLGFMDATIQYGLDNWFGSNPYYGTYFSSCFEVSGGDGDLLDYCNPQLSSANPTKALDNDIISLVYDNTVVTTDLSSITDIYFCGKAFTTTGEEYEVCEQTTKTLMVPLGGQKYRIDLWPRGFFQVPKGKTLSRIEYYYTDATGSIKVGYGNTSDPFKYTFKCPE